MVRIATILAISFSLVFMPAPRAMAQAVDPQQQELDAQGNEGGPRKQIAIIIFSGLAGMVLGLSTLSFYGRPQDKLSNVGIGFAVGVIAGTVYTTYRAATKPRQFYEGTDGELPEIWSQENLANNSNEPQAPGLGVVFEF